METGRAGEGAMLVLSDGPEPLESLLPGATGARVAVASLPAQEQALWGALGPGVPPWRGRGSDIDPPGFWSLAVIVDEAPTSQFDRLHELLADGLELPGPTACLALTGRGFHGQRGRPWLSVPGNLHLCTVLPEPGLAARDAHLLTMLPAVALVEAVRALSADALRPGIKWVNDIVLEGRKIGGVLCATQTLGDRVQSILLGLGLNLATAPRVPPTAFVPSVGCLADAGSAPSVGEALVHVLAGVGRLAGEVVRSGTLPLFEAYRNASVVIDREVCIFADPPTESAAEARSSPVCRGTVRDIAPDLTLRLDGFATPVARGRLAFAEDCRRFAD